MTDCLNVCDRGGASASYLNLLVTYLLFISWCIGEEFDALRLSAATRLCIFDLEFHHAELFSVCFWLRLNLESCNSTIIEFKVEIGPFFSILNVVDGNCELWLEFIFEWVAGEETIDKFGGQVCRFKRLRQFRVEELLNSLRVFVGFISLVIFWCLNYLSHFIDFVNFWS